MHLTVSAVRYEHQGQARHGVCSTFLADHSETADVPVFVQPTNHFRPPSDANAPMIMVGPGTGIAPFRGFLQERQALGHRGRNWLFFGERNSDKDFYYQDELQGWHDDGFLTHLTLAFSRDQRQKVYVQDRLREHGSRVWAWLQDGGHFYVCGDASRMAKDVDRTLHEIAQTHGHLSDDDADRLPQAAGQGEALRAGRVLTLSFEERTATRLAHDGRVTVPTPLSGQLLVAKPRLGDPNFHRTVILLLDHSDDGAFGVVLNRPVDVEVDAVLPAWHAAVTPPSVLFQGGPVGLDTAIGVVTFPAAGPRYSPTVDRLVGPFGLVDLDSEPARRVGPGHGLARLRGALRLGRRPAGGRARGGSWFVAAPPCRRTRSRATRRRCGGGCSAVRAVTSRSCRRSPRTRGSTDPGASSASPGACRRRRPRNAAEARGSGGPSSSRRSRSAGPSS